MRTSDDDPTRVRSQPSLTTASGTIWIVVGGFFVAVALGVLVPMTALPPAGVALVAAIVVGALYLAMVVVRVAVPAGRRRLGMLAVGMLLIAVISLVSALIVAAAAFA
jgi:hypothetical protein